MKVPLTDDSIMTWGKAHKGKMMSQVPDAYLLWMWDQQLGGADILAYIKNNLDNLKRYGS